MKNYSVHKISYSETKPWILNIHYAHRMPSISYSFGLFDRKELVGIITYGSPASPWLCKGICGEQNRDKVIELNRLVLKYNRRNEASFLIGQSLKKLPPNMVVVSYADTKEKHIGIVYQATNWLYTGATKKRTDMASKNGKHSRHNLGDRTKRQIRSSKHRYVTFTGTRKQHKVLRSCLNYKTFSYPKNKED